MPTRSSKLDMNQLAKRLLDEATGDEPKTEQPPVKNEAAVALGKLGGKKGGAARAAGISDKLWSIEDICNLVPEPEAKKRGPYKVRKDPQK
jgi:hypothetical protein